MKAFVAGSILLLATACSAYSVAVSSQYQKHDGHGGYSYGYADPNSKKHEESSHGVVHGGYSYVDGHGHIQSVKYTADPIHGFHVEGTNLPKSPEHVPSYAAPWAYHSAPLLHHDGTPIETPEVQAAKAAHFAAHAEANSRAHGIYKRSIWGYASPHSFAPAPVNGVPVDTPEVAHAKAEHLAAHSRALVESHDNYGYEYNGADDGQYRGEQEGQYNGAQEGQYNGAQEGHHSYYPQHIPVIKNGVPVETPEVQHAKAAHFAAVAKAGGHGIHHAPAHHAHSHYPEHIPVIHNGVPVDTVEVQHAKAAHFAAVAKAGGYAASNDHHSHYHHIVPVIHNGVPVDTPEVQHAKAAHFAALAKAKSSSSNYDNGHWDHHSHNQY